MNLLNLVKQKLYLICHLSISDWLIIIESWFLLVYFHLVVYFISYNQLEKTIGQAVDDCNGDPRGSAIGEHVGRLVGYASRCHIISMTCLIRSLTIQRILAGKNIPAQIRIGVQKKQELFFAHAWVEVNGKPIGESNDVSKIFNVLGTVTKLGTRYFK